MFEKNFKTTFFVHYALPTVLSLSMVCVALIEVHDFKPNDWDYGIFSNLLWNFAHGNGWLMTLYAGENREFFLADHLVLLTPLFSLPFMVVPSSYTLSVLHGFAFATVFFLAPVFVQTVYQQQGSNRYFCPAILLLLALWLFPGISGAWRYQSHMTTLSMPFVLLALVFLHKDKLVPAIICCVLLALAQERSSVAVFGIGMYAILLLRKYKLGFALCVFSAVYFIVAVKIIIPLCATGGGYHYASSINPFVDMEQKFLFLGKCCVGWFLLICLGKRPLMATLCALPVVAIGLVSSRPSMYQFVHHYQDLPSIFLFAAATHGMFVFSEKINDRKKILLAILVVCCSIGVMYKNFVFSNPIYRLATRDNLHIIQTVRNEFLRFENLKQDTKIWTSSGIGPYFSMRKYLHHVTPQKMQQEFENTMIFIAPTLNMYPYDPEQTRQILSNIQNNQSLKPVLEHEHLYVYASRDIETP